LVLSFGFWVLGFAQRHDQITNCVSISPKTQNSKLKTQNSKPTSPRGSAVVLCIRPGRFGVGPGLTVLVFLKPYSDLIPSNGIAGSVIATIQSKCG
jgi:hypothetical protein